MKQQRGYSRTVEVAESDDDVRERITRLLGFSKPSDLGFFGPDGKWSTLANLKGEQIDRIATMYGLPMRGKVARIEWVYP